MNKTKTKTKRTKIIISIILIFVAVCTAILLTLQFNNISYLPNINKPSRIIIYYNSEKNNVVFEQNDEEFNLIYSSLTKAHKQSLLNATFNGELLKKCRIIENDPSSISFEHIKLCFDYNLPQSLKLKNDLYSYNNNVYWYQQLIFDIINNDDFKYNSIAIIPPSNSPYYVDQFTYTLQYLSYSKLDNAYNIINSIV
ncbi:MAG: hypothetical protein ACLRFE_02415 [Clostridia bacterium]